MRTERVVLGDCSMGHKGPQSRQRAEFSLRRERYKHGARATVFIIKTAGQPASLHQKRIDEAMVGGALLRGYR